MDPIILVTAVSLIVQIVVFLLLVLGYFYKRKLKFYMHGAVMAVAVALHLITVFAVMVPSFVLGVIPYYVIPEPLMVISLASVIHGVLGIVAIVLGVYLVAAWAFRRNVNGCFKRKNVMRLTISVWFASLILGFLLYITFYGTTLFG
ncbi:hypothetical protein GX563_11740 [Candidatus Bathyarchaeota archaeon]|nr:hypothetical protein [Candidatus Bathyarchaeota archaeon]